MSMQVKSLTLVVRNVHGLLRTTAHKVGNR